MTNLVSLMVPCMKIELETQWILGLLYNKSKVEENSGRSFRISSENNPAIGRQYVASRFVLDLKCSSPSWIEVHALSKGGWIMESHVNTTVSGAMSREFREFLHFETRSKSNSGWKIPDLSDLMFRALYAEQVQCILCDIHKNTHGMCSAISALERETQSIKKEYNSWSKVVSDLIVRSRKNARKRSLISAWGTDTVQMNYVVRGWNIEQFQVFGNNPKVYPELIELREKLGKEWPGYVRERQKKKSVPNASQNSVDVIENEHASDAAYGVNREVKSDEFMNEIGALYEISGGSVDFGGVAKKKGVATGKKRGRKPKGYYDNVDQQQQLQNGKGGSSAGGSQKKISKKGSFVGVSDSGIVEDGDMAGKEPVTKKKRGRPPLKNKVPVKKSRISSGLNELANTESQTSLPFSRFQY
eukprot:CAMPEP_0182449948 /NCGR_PEP_ID=MMETSP1172-20130603/37805_1 /TAXON_ID=708627 /ORGANISM="Timspurckia oligopyrenoides, Strain CCMP3278" /LENGTH=414 /DNA_ID=CAMNT_0024647383 /DNA_START=297 /DNA_END=1541 /DNA_ORIENTATION=+